MSTPQEFRIFISGVTSEFGKARDEIANDLSARGLLVKVQPQFRQEADTETTLAKLNKYISGCFAVVHIAGVRSGGSPGEDEAKPFRDMLPPDVARASYMQWEFHLAHHHKRRLSIYIANADYKPDEPTATNVDDDPALQSEHIAVWRNWIASILRRPIIFAVSSFEKTGQRWPSRSPATSPSPRSAPFFPGVMRPARSGQESQAWEETKPE